jgi:hypothetical protein
MGPLSPSYHRQYEKSASLPSPIGGRQGARARNIVVSLPVGHNPSGSRFNSFINKVIHAKA